MDFRKDSIHSSEIDTTSRVLSHCVLSTERDKHLLAGFNSKKFIESDQSQYQNESQTKAEHFTLKIGFRSKFIFTFDRSNTLK